MWHESLICLDYSKVISWLAEFNDICSTQTTVLSRSRCLARTCTVNFANCYVCLTQTECPESESTRYSAHSTFNCDRERTEQVVPSAKMIISRNAWICIGAAVVLTGITCAIVFSSGSDSQTANLTAGGSSVLLQVPLVDGHNDLPHNLYSLLNNQLETFHFDSDLRKDTLWGVSNSSHTDLPRLRDGRVGGQFWVAYVSCKTQHKDAVERTMQQIDVIKRLIKAYPDHLQYATTADGKISL